MHPCTNCAAEECEVCTKWKEAKMAWLYDEENAMFVEVREEDLAPGDKVYEYGRYYPKEMDATDRFEIAYEAQRDGSREAWENGIPFTDHGPNIELNPDYHECWEPMPAVVWPGPVEIVVTYKKKTCLNCKHWSECGK